MGKKSLKLAFEELKNNNIKQIVEIHQKAKALAEKEVRHYQKNINKKIKSLQKEKAKLSSEKRDEIKKIEDKIRELNKNLIDEPERIFSEKLEFVVQDTFLCDIDFSNSASIDIYRDLLSDNIVNLDGSPSEQNSVTSAILSYLDTPKTDQTMKKWSSYMKTVNKELNALDFAACRANQLGNNKEADILWKLHSDLSEKLQTLKSVYDYQSLHIVYDKAKTNLEANKTILERLKFLGKDKKAIKNAELAVKKAEKIFKPISKDYRKKEEMIKSDSQFSKIQAFSSENVRVIKGGFPMISTEDTLNLIDGYKAASMKEIQAAKSSLKPNSIIERLSRFFSGLLNACKIENNPFNFFKAREKTDQAVEKTSLMFRA